jgi:phosphoribosylanthranilate isomerase
MALPAAGEHAKFPTMFQIKICGITNVADAEAAVAAGADAIGLNFYAPSPRSVTRAAAADIAKVVGDRVCKVGVFVNAPVDEIIATSDELGLELIQLHGEEQPDVLRKFAPRPVMKAFRIGPYGLLPLRAWLEDCTSISLFPQSVLIDAFQPAKFGGTGVVADWSKAAAYVRTPSVPPLVLAGGLTPENVAEAIHAVRPAAIDTASGVESAPGVKDAAKMRAFVAAARQAFG